MTCSFGSNWLSAGQRPSRCCCPPLPPAVKVTHHVMLSQLVGMGGCFVAEIDSDCSCWLLVGLAPHIQECGSQRTLRCLSLQGLLLLLPAVDCHSRPFLLLACWSRVDGLKTSIAAASCQPRPSNAAARAGSM